MRTITTDRNKDVYVVKPSWNEKDESNYHMLKDIPENMGRNYFGVKRFLHIPKTFKEFAESDFLSFIIDDNS